VFTLVNLTNPCELTHTHTYMQTVKQLMDRALKQNTGEHEVTALLEIDGLLKDFIVLTHTSLKG